MLGWLVEGLAYLIGGSLGMDCQQRAVQRHRQRDFLAGRDTFLVGSVEGPVPYASPGGAPVWLVISGGSLFWTADRGFGRGLWHPIPVAELTLISVTPTRARTSDWTRWAAFSCRHGQRDVTLTCPDEDSGYLAAALVARHLPLPG